MFLALIVNICCSSACSLLDTITSEYELGVAGYADLLKRFPFSRFYIVI